MRKKICIFSILIFLIDLVSKFIIIHYEYELPIVVIDNFFSITKVTNYGAAFSMLSGFTLFLIFIGLFVLFYIYEYLLKDVTNKVELVGYILVIGGVLGNLFDRIFYGKVIDFLSFKFGDYHFPIFNFADIFICVGIVLVIIGYLKNLKSKKGE